MTSRERNGFGVPMDTYGSTDDTASFINKDQLMMTATNYDSDTPLEFTSKHDRPDRVTFFEDGVRRIDYILVYEEEHLTEKQRRKKEEKERERREKGKKVPDSDEQKEAWRHKFLDNLKKLGVEVEEDIIEGEKKTIFYIKLHAPWDLCVFYAEELNFRAPLQAHSNPSSNWSEKALKKLHIPNIMALDVPNTPYDYFTCPFRKNKLDRFIGSDNHIDYFTMGERGRILNEILQSTTYGKRKRAEIGIDRLVEEEIFTAAFPLHDGPYEKPKHLVSNEDLNKRQVLYEYWARWGRWYKYQPLDHIREYFGEKIGIYFAWLGFYTAWLLPSSIIGLIVFIFGIVTINDNTPAQEICNHGGEFLMCPLCDEKIGCAYWNLSDTCLQATVAYLFDHPGTVFYAIFMSFWAVTFLEYWKRKEASLAHHWDCMDFEEEEQRPRPAFAAAAPLMEKNPITGIKEPHFPDDQRLRRVATGLAVLFCMASLVIIFLLGVILYRVLVSIPLFKSPVLRGQAQSIASMSGAVVNLILIMALSNVYTRVAMKLNDWEMHRTQTEYEDQLTFKVFVFQFVNFYSSIFYIAFFKGRFNGYPGNYSTIFGLRNEECGQGGCLVELAQQLLVIMVGKQVINNCQELAIPKVKQFIQRYKVQGKMKGKVEREQAQWEEDYQLVEYEGLFDEYLEMVLQFGFITIFVAALPIAPLFALLNNWVEIRLDAAKFVCELRRPVADRGQDIGVWFNILDTLTQLAVVSNAFVIAFTSEFLPKLMYKYNVNADLVGYVNFTLSTSPPGALSQRCRYQDYRDDEGNETIFYWKLLCVRLGFVILFEHFVFICGKLIDFFVPDVPEALEIKIKREKYLAKQALAENIATVPGAEDEPDRGAQGVDEVTLDVPTT
ncbi:anoctamin-7-like isoform X2 [Glandiceps talaboti]